MDCTLCHLNVASDNRRGQGEKDNMCGPGHRQSSGERRRREHSSEKGLSDPEQMVYLTDLNHSWCCSLRQVSQRAIYKGIAVSGALIKERGGEKEREKETERER